MPGESGLSRAYMQKAVERSLKRLQTDYIDLYQSHRDDPNTPIEETLSAYQDLIKAGKVRAIGASNFTPARLRESLQVSKAKGLPRYESLQPWYNLHDRAQFEEPRGDSLAELCKAENLGVIPLLRAGERVPYGQVPVCEGRRGQRARLSHQGHAE